MTDALEFTPNLRRPKKIALLFVVDTWGIEGPYADGNWHKLIHQAARSWITENPDQEPATLCVGRAAVRLFRKWNLVLYDL